MERGLSEDALGENVGISGMTVHLYETGQADPGEKLAGIAAATGRPLSWFTDDEVLQPAPAAHVPPPVEEAELPPLEEAAVEEPDPLEERAAELDEREAALDAERLRLEALAADLAAGEAALEARAAAEPDPGKAEVVTEPVSEPERSGDGDPGPLHPHDVGGKSMIVDTADGGHVRVSASRRDNPEGNHLYVSEYEVMSATTWEGKPIFVWEQVRTYRACEGYTVEECLEAALAEIEAGPRPPEPEELERPLVPEELPQVPVSGYKRRRGLLGFLRR